MVCLHLPGKLNISKNFFKHLDDMERRNSHLAYVKPVKFSTMKELHGGGKINVIIYLINVFDSLKYWNFLMTNLNSKILTITMNFQIDLSDCMQKSSQQGQTVGKS